MDKVRLKLAGRPKPKTTLGVMVRLEEDLDAERYNPNRGFGYAEDVKAYPFAWQPTGPVRVSVSPSKTCPCGAPVRTLKPNTLARPRLCADCLKPDDDTPEIDLADVIRRCKPGSNPLLAVALHLPGLADALDAPERAKPKPRGRDYTVNEKREAVRLYRDTGLGQTEISEKLGVPLSTVKTWIRRYEREPYFLNDLRVSTVL